MNRTPVPPTLNSPPPSKACLLTVVDAFTPGERPVALTSPEGKRRLFRHRAWAERTCDGWLRVMFAPGWLATRPTGTICHITEDVCRDEPGELDALLERTSALYGVHLWVAPIRLPRNIGPFGDRYRSSLYSAPNEHALSLAASWSAA